MCMSGIGKKIEEKYRKSSMDRFRWSLKPVFIKYLLQEKNYDKVIFVDPDLYFFNDYDFLFDELDLFDILLTPHWRNRDPSVDPANFHANFVDGIFNAGFIGVSKNGYDAMDWWARACEYACKKDPEIGLFDDQAYLNVFPVYFRNVGILRHKGCNVANWNRVECPRIVQSDGSVLINGTYPIIFIHFHRKTILSIIRGTDPHLFPYLEQYASDFRRYRPDVDIIDTYRMKSKDRKKTNKGVGNIARRGLKKMLTYWMRRRPVA